MFSKKIKNLKEVAILDLYLTIPNNEPAHIAASLDIEQSTVESVIEKYLESSC